MIRTQWTRKQVGKTGGHGDKIMASTNDPAQSWYWRELAPERGTYNFDFKPKRGRLAYDRTPGLIADVADAVLIEPHVKRTFSADNKDFGFERWQQVVDRVPLRFVQCLHHGLPQLSGVDVIHTSSFEHAVSVLAASRGIVLCAGGLSHAAAALSKPAVVVFGGHAPPEVLGYDAHVNLAAPDPAALGWRISHPACRAAMQRISVESVVEAIESLFGGAP